MNEDLQPNEIELINAYVDGELAADDRQRFEVQLAERSELRAAVADLESLRRVFEKFPKHVLSDEFAEHVLVAAEHQMLLGEVQEPSPFTIGTPDAGVPSPRLRSWWVVVAVAASVLGLLLIPNWIDKVDIAQAPKPMGEKASEPLAATAQGEASESISGEQSQPGKTVQSAAPQLSDSRTSRSVTEAGARKSINIASDEIVGGTNEADAITSGATRANDQYFSAPIADGDMSMKNARRPSAEVADFRRDQYSALAIARPPAESELLIEVQVPIGNQELARKDSTDSSIGGARLEVGAQQTPDGKEFGDIVEAQPARGSIAESVGRFVAIETSTDQAADILARLEDSGAVLRDHPMTPVLSQQLASEFVAQQSRIAGRELAELTCQKSDQDSADDETTESTLAQTQVENIASAQARLDLSVDTEQAGGQEQIVVRLNQKVPQELKAAWEKTATIPAESNRISNQAITEAMQRAKSRQFGPPRGQRELQSSQLSSELKRRLGETGQPVRLYLWVRELPAN